MPKEGVTIAIPNWNHEFLLARSIESALTTLKALANYGVVGEVLVVDDCSRDGSLVLLRQLEALHFSDGLRVWALDENVGPSDARNQALQLARFRYIAFLDADNEIVSENLYHFYRAIKQTEAIAVYGNLIGLADGQMRLLSNQSVQPQIFTGNYIDTCALFDRVQILDCGGFQSEQLLKGTEDWELYLHLASLGRRIIFVPLAFGIYHDLSNSLHLEAAQRVHDILRKVHRMFNQLEIRGRMPHNTWQLRYHPDIGYL